MEPTARVTEILIGRQGRCWLRPYGVEEWQMISFRHATVLACTGADPVYDAANLMAIVKAGQFHKRQI